MVDTIDPFISILCHIVRLDFRTGGWILENMQDVAEELLGSVEDRMASVELDFPRAPGTSRSIFCIQWHARAAPPRPSES